MNIRIGKKEDMASVLGLIQELADFEKEPEAVKITVEDLIRDGFGQQPLFHVFVAEMNSNSGEKEIVGIALYYYRYSTWKGPVLYLEDLIVTESFRGNGIGKALFEKCIAHAKHNNYRRMVWQVLDWNTPAIDFYKGYGAQIEDGWLNASIDF